MTANPHAALIERLKARIHGLTDHGAHICAEFQPQSESPVGCGRCGYTAEVHMLRDCLAALADAPVPPATPVCARCKGTGFEADNVFVCAWCHGNGEAAVPLATCSTHGDPLVCIACEQEEDARPEWQAQDGPRCEIHRVLKLARVIYCCEDCEAVPPATAGETCPTCGRESGQGFTVCSNTFHLQSALSASPPPLSEQDIRAQAEAFIAEWSRGQTGVSTGVARVYASDLVAFVLSLHRPPDAPGDGQ